MIHTITIDVINDKALKLLHDLEMLQLIHVHRKNKQSKTALNWASKYKGAMQKQPMIEVDNQLNDLRNAWE
ncbi:MAG: hypothetical protein WCX31_08760 [Salinivirgaceae bacterium]